MSDCTEHRSPFKTWRQSTRAVCEWADKGHSYHIGACRFDDPLPREGCMVPECLNEPFWSPLCEEHIEVLVDYEDTKRVADQADVRGQ